MARLMAFKLREFEKNTLTFEIGCSFLTFNFLEKRIDGAKMIHVKDVKDIPLEFHVQITAEMKRGHKFLGIEYPSRWILRSAMLRDGQMIRGDKVKVDVDGAETLS